MRILWRSLSNIFLATSLLLAPVHSLAKPARGFVGINCAIWDPNLDSPKVESLLVQAGVTSLRWPGGSGANSYDWTKPPNWAHSTEEFDHLATALGAEVTITTNYGTGSPQMAVAWLAYCNTLPSHDVKIGRDCQGRDWKSSAYWAKLRISKPLNHDDGLNFLRIARTKPYGFRNWEIGNECYGSWELDTHSPAHDPAEYARFAVASIHLMRQIDPSAQLGVVVTGLDRPYFCQETVIDPITKTATDEWTPIVLSALANHNARPDFIAYHHYAQDSGHESDENLFADSSRIPKIADRLKRLVESDFGSLNSKVIGIACTECNSVAFNPGPQTTGKANAIYYSELAKQVKSAGFENLIWWDLHNSPSASGYDDHSSLNQFSFGDYGILGIDDRLNVPYPVYYAIKSFATGE